MLTIRLARTGRKKLAMYRIVVADSKRATTGRYVNLLGHYNPHTKELSIKKEDMERYLSNGAQPSNAVAKLLAKEGVKLPEWVTITTRSRAPKKAAPAEPEADKAAPAAEEGEAAAESVAPEATEPVAEVAAAEASAKEETASAPTAEVETKSSGPEDPKTETAESGEAAQAAAEEASRTAADVATEAAQEKSAAA